jgi:oleandomycin transport system permease protein
MTTDASTLAGGLPGAGGGRITPVAALRHWLLVGRRDLLQVRSNPQLLVFVLIQPILFVLLFVYVFGTAMTGIGLNEDLAKGIIDRFRSPPIARSAVLAGRILADAVRLVASLAVILGVGMALGFRITTSPPAALGGFLLIIGFGMALSWVAALIGLSAGNPETAQSAGFIWMFPLIFASSVFAPPETMPGWLQPFVDLNPITVATDALRGLLLGGPVLSPALQTLAWTAALTVVFAPWRSASSAGCPEATSARAREAR